MDVTCLRSLALNILKNSYPESIASSIEIPELEPCSICNEELFLHQLKKSFTVLTCGHIFHRLCLENNRENTTICPNKNCVAEIEIIERSPLARMSSQRSMSIDGSQDKSFDPTIFNNAFLDNDPTCLDTITEEISNHVRNIESDIPETSTASTLPSKRVGDPTSVDKPSNKKPKAVNREDSLKLKKLIEELANSPSQELSISASDSVSTIDTLNFLHLYREITKAETRNEKTKQEVIQCYYNFGELLSQRFYFHYSQVKNDQMAQVEVNKEAREQLPSNISGDAFKKRTERARKVYFLFSQEHIGKEKIGLVKSFTALTISKLSLGDIKYIINKTKPS
ncbi:14293_t:CDS:1 [Entrophospora sp. SA101]|nr:14293_t:CDS:1 [Entrophospora sp. SA101]